MWHHIINIGDSPSPFFLSLPPLKENGKLHFKLYKLVGIVSNKTLYFKKFKLNTLKENVNYTLNSIRA